MKKNLEKSGTEPICRTEIETQMDGLWMDGSTREWTCGYSQGSRGWGN